MYDKITYRLLESIESPILISILILLIVFITVYKTSLVDLFKYSVLNIGKGNADKKVKELRSHDVFNTLKRSANEVKLMKFYTHGKYDKVKTKMCYDFTKNKAKHCAIHMKKIIDNPNIDSMDLDTLKNLVLRTQVDMHVDYINATRNFWLDKGIEKEDVEHIVHLFEKFRYDVVNSFEHRITAFFGSGYHPNNFEKMLAVFDMWAMGIDLLPRDMQTTFENLNGKFKDIKY
jgi:hypothetical protein